jgi:hypothetical protein
MQGIVELSLIASSSQAMRDSALCGVIVLAGLYHDPGRAKIGCLGDAEIAKDNRGDVRLSA